MKVLKFGGSVLADASCIKRCCALICSEASQKSLSCVVVSAHGDTTDRLISLARKAEMRQDFEKDYQALKERHEALLFSLCGSKEAVRKQGEKSIGRYFSKLHSLLSRLLVIRDLHLAALDEIMCYGELFSACIIASYLQCKGLSAEMLDMRKLLHTSRHYGAGKVLLSRSAERIVKHFSNNKALQIATGFIASTLQGESITLGRDGSNVTSAIIAYALDVPRIEVWTHVNGVCAISPDKVPHAHTISYLSYSEAREMAFYGAKILHRSSLEPIREKGIQLIIRNLFHPDQPSTTIGKTLTAHKVKGMATLQKISLVSIKETAHLPFAEFCREVFQILERQQGEILFMMHAPIEQTLLLATTPQQAHDIQQLLHRAQEQATQKAYHVTIEEGLSVIAVIGHNIHQQAGIISQAFNALAKEKIPIIATAQGASHHNLCMIIREEHLHATSHTLYTAFFVRETA